MEALRSILGDLLSRADVVALPDPDGARARPLRVFSDPLQYQREVLQVDC